MNYEKLIGELGPILVASLIFATIWFRQEKKSSSETKKPSTQEPSTEVKCTLGPELKLWLITEVRDPIIEELKK